MLELKLKSGGEEAVKQVPMFRAAGSMERKGGGLCSYAGWKAALRSG